MIDRRAILFAGAVGVTLAGAKSAAACSIIPETQETFSDTSNRRSIEKLVSALGRGPGLGRDEASSLAQIFTFDHVEPGDKALEQFYTGDGRPDAKPPKVLRTHLLRRVRNRALYAVRIERRRYYAERGDCNGLTPFPAGYRTVQFDYLFGTHNNDVISIRHLPEWDLEGVSEPDPWNHG